MPRFPPSTIEVLPPSRRSETGTIVRVAVVIAVGALLWIGGRRARAAREIGGRVLLPFQVSFAELEPALQRAVRELHEGALEALRLRGAEGRWPDAARLAAELVPPFADDGVDRGRRRWSSRAAPFAFQYLGRPSRDDGTRALLLRILEPPPGDLEGRDPRASLAPDEQHRRLADGTLLHVSFWIESAGVMPSSEEIVREPALEGWNQVLCGVGSGS